MDQMKLMSPSQARYLSLNMLHGAQKLKGKGGENRKSNLCMSRILLEVKSRAEK